MAALATLEQRTTLWSAYPTALDFLFHVATAPVEAQKIALSVICFVMGRWESDMGC